MEAKDQLVKKKLQTQNMIIVALVIVIFVLVCISTTAAWYIRTKTDTADFILNHPVNIYITNFKELKDSANNVVYDKDGNPIYEHTEAQNLTEHFTNVRINPGDKIDMRLGVQIGNKAVESSPAFVRVKLIVTFENIYTGETTKLADYDDSLIDYQEGLVSEYWEMVDFNETAIPEPGEEVKEDIWFVLKDTNESGQTVARIAYNLESFEFVDGYIKIDRLNVTNKHANCKIHVNYVVEAIQIANIDDPIVYRTGPWWEHEDIIYN